MQFIIRNFQLSYQQLIDGLNSHRMIITVHKQGCNQMRDNQDSMDGMVIKRGMESTED